MNIEVRKIAEIIKREMEEISNSSMNDIDKEVARASPRVIACHLTDLFEREDSKKEFDEVMGMSERFNRLQFLKDCGVE